MPAGIAITNVEESKRLARTRKDAQRARRLRAIALVIEGDLDRGTIARQARVDRQTPCDWVNRYNAQGTDGLKDRTRSGRFSKLDADQKAQIKRRLVDGPQADVPARTVNLLKAKMQTVFDVVMSREAVRSLIRAPGFRKLSPRPLHPKANQQRSGRFSRRFRYGSDGCPARRHRSDPRGRMVSG